MWTVWRVTGRDPYLIYHDLDDQFCPMGGGEPMPPPYPFRRTAMLAAFGQHEFEHEARLHGAKLPGDDERARRHVRERQER